MSMRERDVVSPPWVVAGQVMTVVIPSAYLRYQLTG